MNQSSAIPIHWEKRINRIALFVFIFLSLGLFFLFYAYKSFLSTEPFKFLFYSLCPKRWLGTIFLVLSALFCYAGASYLINYFDPNPALILQHHGFYRGKMFVSWENLDSFTLISYNGIENQLTIKFKKWEGDMKQHIEFWQRWLIALLYLNKPRIYLSAVSIKLPLQQVISMMEEKANAFFEAQKRATQAEERKEEH